MSGSAAIMGIWFSENSGLLRRRWIYGLRAELFGIYARTCKEKTGVVSAGDAGDDGGKYFNSHSGC